MFKPKKIFILENGKQKEISFEHFIYLKENDESFKSKTFVCTNGMIFEADPHKRNEYYSDKRRAKYITEMMKELGVVVISYDSLDTNDFCGESILVDSSPGPEELVEEKIMNEKLYQSISTLSPTEKYIIKSYYFDELTDQKIGDVLGVAQNTVSYRRRKTLKKLAKILKN